MSGPDEQSFTTEEAAKELGLSPGAVRILIRSKLLDADKRSGRYFIVASEVIKFKAKYPAPSKIDLQVTDTGMIEISVGLTGVSAAIMTLIPASFGAEIVRAVIYGTALVVGLASLYSSLWLLGEYAQDVLGLKITGGETNAGLGHIFALLTSPDDMGPYWLTAVCLILLFVVLAVTGYVSAF